MERFSSLRFPVHRVTDPLDKAFPDLFRLQEFKKLKLRADIDWQKLVKYICFMYDPKSDLIQEFQGELKERKEAAAVEAGFEREPNGKWPKALLAGMEIKDPEIHAAIMAFLKIFKNHEWTDIVVTEQELYEFQSLRFKAINDESSDIYGDAKKKDGLMASASDRRASLKILRAEFYGDNKDLEAPEFDEMITPENAERILATMPPPYEEIKPEAQSVLPD